MAAARSVIVRFTSSSTSTAAPAAARLASLRQRVLQARSGVPKIVTSYRKSARRTSSTANLARHRPTTPRTSRRAHTRAQRRAATDLPLRRPNCRNTQTHCRPRRGRSPQKRWRDGHTPPSRRRAAPLATHAPDWENDNQPPRRSRPPSPAPTPSRATSRRATASRTPPCA